MRLPVLAAFALAVALAPAAQAQSASSVEGVWRNPKNSVHVHIKPCGQNQNLCGYVVWASEDAKADAKKAGTDNLIGMQLLRNFGPEKPGLWRGKVYVPDLRATFGGTAELVDARTLKAKGCLLAGVLCKSQTWRKIDSAA